MVCVYVYPSGALAGVFVITGDLILRELQIDQAHAKCMLQERPTLSSLPSPQVEA